MKPWKGYRESLRNYQQHYYYYHSGRPVGKSLGLFKTLFILGIGVYGGIYISQNYEISKMEKPSNLWAKFKDWLKQFEKSNATPYGLPTSTPTPTSNDANNNKK
jgi:hypothetical protein